MPMFSQQHYKAIAQVLASTRPPFADETVSAAFLEGRDEQFTNTLVKLCQMFHSDNPAFKENVFMEAVQQLGTEPRRRNRDTN